MEMRYIKTDDQVFDMFTKNLSPIKFEKFINQLKVVQKMRVNVKKEC